MNDSRTTPAAVRTAPGRTRRPLHRRLLFAALLLTGLWLLVEAISFVAHFAVHGERFSFARVHAKQAARTRAWAGADSGGVVRDSGEVTCLHPYLGYVNDFSTDDQMLTPGCDYGVSRFGFVDDRGPVRARDPRKLLVGIFGGSVAQFFGSGGADELADRLRAHRAYAGRRIEFVRLGVIGFKQPQQLFTLVNLLALGGELDIAVNLDGLNEVTLGPENVSRGVPAVFPRNWSLLAEHTTDVEQRRLIGTVVLLQEAQVDLAAWFGAGPWRWSVAAGLLWRSLDGWLDRAAGGRLLRLQQHRRADLPFHVTGPGVQADATDPDALADAGTATWAHCSRVMHRVCEAHGIRYFHFLQPNQYLTASKPLSEEERRHAWTAAASQKPWVERAFPRLREAGRRLTAEGLRYEDLTQLFADVRETIYIDDCCHVNAAGNRRIAQAIAAAILRDPGTGAGTSPPSLTALRAEPAVLSLGRPLERVELRVLGMREDGSEDDVTWAHTTYASSEPAVIAVDRHGMVTALSDGEASIEIRCGRHGTSVPVAARFPRVADLGGGFAPRPLVAPALHAIDDGTSVVLRLVPPGRDLPGAVAFAVTPAPRPLCGGTVFVPLQSLHIEMVGASAGELRVPFASPDPRRRTVYVQAVYRIGHERCGFAVSNALAITQ